MDIPPPEIIRVKTLQVACDGSGDIPASWRQFHTELAGQRRAATIRYATGRIAWVAAERLPAMS